MPAYSTVGILPYFGVEPANNAFSERYRRSFVKNDGSPSSWVHLTGGIHTAKKELILYSIRDNLKEFVMLKRLKIMFDGKHPLHWYRPGYRKYVEQVLDQGATHFTYEWRDNWVVFFRENQETSTIEECIFHVNKSELSPWKATNYKANSEYDPRNRQPPYINPVGVIFE